MNVKLDFSKLNSLGKHTENAPEPPKTPLEPLTEDKQYKSSPKAENTPEGQTEGLQGMRMLQREADKSRAAKERATAVYSDYQKNIQLTEQLQADIVNGVKRGEDIYSLFLTAAQAISLMTSNTALYSQLKEDVKAVYGAGEELSEHVKPGNTQKPATAPPAAHSKRSKPQTQSTPQSGTQSTIQSFESLDGKSYRTLYRTVFNFHERHNPPTLEDSYWEDAAADMDSISREHAGNHLLQYLLAAVYMELQREYERKVGNTR